MIGDTGIPSTNIVMIAVACVAGPGLNFLVANRCYIMYAAELISEKYLQALLDLSAASAVKGKEG